MAFVKRGDIVVADRGINFAANVALCYSLV